MSAPILKVGIVAVIVLAVFLWIVLSPTTDYDRDQTGAHIITLSDVSGGEFQVNYMDVRNYKYNPAQDTVTIQTSFGSFELPLSEIKKFPPVVRDAIDKARSDSSH